MQTKLFILHNFRELQPVGSYDSREETTRRSEDHSAFSCHKNYGNPPKRKPLLPFHREDAPRPEFGPWGVGLSPLNIIRVLTPKVKTLIMSRRDDSAVRRPSATQTRYATLKASGFFPFPTDFAMLYQWGPHKDVLLALILDGK